MRHAIGRGNFQILSVPTGKAFIDNKTGTAITLERAAMDRFAETLELRESSVQGKLYETEFEDSVSKVLEKIDSLLVDESDDYDDKFLPPIEEKLSQMKSFITELCQVKGKKFIVPAFVPDGKGGIEANWHNNNRYLQVIISASNTKGPYLFHKEGSHYGIEYFTTGSELAMRFDWLMA